jgi:hypothetical protein
MQFSSWFDAYNAPGYWCGWFTPMNTRVNRFAVEFQGNRMNKLAGDK